MFDKHELIIFGQSLSRADPQLCSPTHSQFSPLRPPITGFENVLYVYIVQAAVHTTSGQISEALNGSDTLPIFAPAGCHAAVTYYWIALRICPVVGFFSVLDPADMFNWKAEKGGGSG